MHVLKLLLVTSDKPAAATDTNHQDDATSNNGKPLLSTAEKASGRVSSAVIEAAIRASEKDHEEIHEATLFQEDELYMLDGVPIVEALCQRTIADKNEEATTASAAAYANGAETESDRAGPPQQPTNSTNDTVPSTSADLNRSFDIGLDIDSNGDNEDDDDEEQVLVDLALFNYETFYGLEHGTATLDRVAASSAGILGWAACTLPVVSKQKDDFAEKGEPQFSHSCDAEQPPTLLPPGDDEEARQIQMALLESLLGAHPNHETDTCEYNTYEPEETTSTYDYEDDNTSSSNESDASNSIETAGIAATADEKEDVKVALDTTPAAKSCPAAFSRNKKINKSSWQFQEVLKQVKCRGEATWDSNKGSKDSNINSGPVRNSIASQQDEGVLAREPSNANNEASKRQTDTPSSDTDSWSEVSIGDTNKCDSTQKRCGKKTDTTDATLSGDWHWEVVGASDEDDDWSTGS